MVTQEQIARQLGVSRQLVTLALGGYPQVSAASRKRIQAAARSMGYRPNPHARALKRGRTGILALWIPDQISTHYSHVARELNRLVKQARHELVISEVGDTVAEEVWSHVPVDGVFAVDTPEAVRAHLRSPGGRAVPVISMGAACCEQTDAVQVDLRAGTRELMAHLLAAGFRRIVHATFVPGGQPGAHRRREYALAMRRAGLLPAYFEYPLSEQQRPIVRQLVRDYVQAHGCPEVFFCHSDDVAIGIYRGLCDLNLRVPADVALAGCDGIPDTEYLECPLTTLVQPVPAMCATAWQFLLRRLERPAAPRQRAVLRPRLEIRSSTQRGGSLDLAGDKPIIDTVSAPG